MTETKLRTLVNLGALPPDKKLVRVGHTYTKVYTDYFYTVVSTNKWDGGFNEQAEDLMDQGFMESFDYDEMELEDDKISTEVVEYDVNDNNMRTAVNRWTEYEEDKK